MAGGAPRWPCSGVGFARDEQTFKAPLTWHYKTLCVLTQCPNIVDTFRCPSFSSLEKHIWTYPAQCGAPRSVGFMRDEQTLKPPLAPSGVGFARDEQTFKAPLTWHYKTLCVLTQCPNIVDTFRYSFSSLEKHIWTYPAQCGAPRSVGFMRDEQTLKPHWPDITKHISNIPLTTHV